MAAWRGLNQYENDNNPSSDTKQDDQDFKALETIRNDSF